MGLEVLKFGDKQLILSLSKSALDELISNKICTKTKITKKIVLQELKKGRLLVPYSDNITSQKVSTLKTRGECIKADGFNIPLTTVRDICKYVSTGTSHGDVRTRRVGNRVVVTILEDFLDLKAGQEIRAENGFISSKFGKLSKAQLVEDKLAKVENIDVMDGFFTAKTTGSNYYNSSNDYTIRVLNDKVKIGCKTYNTSMMKQLGKVLTEYLEDE